LGFDPWWGLSEFCGGVRVAPKPLVESESWVWSSWVKRKGTTQVMFIAKLKDGPKRVKKTFSIILKRIFEMV
jgi:hypothetical protein